MTTLPLGPSATPGKMAVDVASAMSIVMIEILERGGGVVIGGAHKVSSVW